MYTHVYISIHNYIPINDTKLATIGHSPHHTHFIYHA